jgi:hypothetical protein
VSQSRNDKAIHILDDLFHWFALGGWSRGQFCLQIAGLHRRQDWPFIDLVEVIGDPVDQIVTQATKVVLAHVAQIGRQLGFGAVHGAHLTTKTISAYLCDPLRLCGK